ncbi:hypothetical protein PHMEG_00025967, partial [Phytophthora megakarya]
MMGFLFYYGLCDSPHGFSRITPAQFDLRLVDDWGNKSNSARKTTTVRDTLSAWCDEAGRIWLPDSASDLQLRICIIGHFGVAGHRSMEVTLATIREHFVWSTLEKDCCGWPTPRPWGEGIHSEKTNEVLHWDYLFMGKPASGEVYLLVLKDDASNFVWLTPCANADAETTYAALVDWLAGFG